jgi:hypothetical protein
MVQNDVNIYLTNVGVEWQDKWKALLEKLSPDDDGDDGEGGGGGGPDLKKLAKKKVQQWAQNIFTTNSVSKTRSVYKAILSRLASEVMRYSLTSNGICLRGITASSMFARVRTTTATTLIIIAIIIWRQLLKQGLPFILPFYTNIRQIDVDIVLHHEPLKHKFCGLFSNPNTLPFTS